jgi:benzoylformate decarboxylase
LARKTGQIVGRGRHRWLVRIFLGRDRETRKRRYHSRIVRGSVRRAQTYLNKVLRDRDLGRRVESVQITLNEYLDRWLETAAKPRLREKSYHSYESLLRRYVRPSLGPRNLAAICPLILTAGQQTREMLLMEPWLADVEPTMLPRPWVKWAYEPVRPQDIPAALMRAVATALQPPSGPVFLSLPLGDWEKPCEGPAVVRTVSQRIAPDPSRLAEFAKILVRAKSPVLIYGAAIARGKGWDQTVAFAEALGAPVWAAPAPERAPFPENHPLYSGGLPFAIEPLSKKLEGHDVALVIGAPVFRYYPYVPGPYLPAGLRLLHISDDPAETARAPIGDSLLGDAVLCLEGLKQLLGDCRPKTTKARETVSHRMAPHGSGAAKVSDDGRLTAAQVFRALNEIRPANTILIEESPSNLADLHREWPITEPDTFYTFASGILDWNLPAAVGIALAERDSGRNRPVIAIIGDGSLQYSVQSLWTATQLRLPILIVVPKNDEYCILKSFAVLEETPGVPGLDIPGFDVVSIAKGYGCDAARLDDQEGGGRGLEQIQADGTGDSDICGVRLCAQAGRRRSLAKRVR